jgi:hypothetical protein
MSNMTLQDHQIEGLADGLAGLGINLDKRGFLQKFAYLVGFNHGSIQRHKAMPDPFEESFNLMLGNALIERTERLTMMAKFSGDPMWSGFEFQNGFDKWRVTVQRIDDNAPITTH